MLLKNIGIENTTVTCDTRFDRVVSVRQNAKPIPIVEEFKGKGRLIIAGSTWPEDEAVLFDSLKKIDDLDIKLVFAPHETDDGRIEKLIQVAGSYFKESEISRFTKNQSKANSKVLIIDKIGLLSSVYQYGTIAWIGGGFTRGIHNILEAAVFGIPVLFGPNYEKFKEAVDLVEKGGAFSVKDKNEAFEKLNMLIIDKVKLEESGNASSSYVNSQTGATDKILAILKNIA